MHFRIFSVTLQRYQQLPDQSVGGYLAKLNKWSGIRQKVFEFGMWLHLDSIRVPHGESEWSWWINSKTQIKTYKNDAFATSKSDE